MTVRHLKIFALVYKEQGITSAAKKLYLAQPAVSQIIKDMELHFGVPLFDRISKKLYPTSHGEKLYKYAIQVLSLYDEMERAMSNKAVHSIRIGTSITIGSHMISEYIKECKKQYPDYKIHIQINSTDKIEKMLLDNMLDFGLVEGKSHSELIESEKFAEDRLLIICPPGHPISKNKSITLNALVEYPLLLREPGSAAREIFDYVMRTRGLSYEPAWESVSTQALVNGVKNGIGISILSEKMVEEDMRRNNVSVVSIEEKLFLRDYYIITHKHKHMSDDIKNVIVLIKQKQQG